jgi:dTDP-glucose pyrophosphorylase/CBS domain-containing protein
MSRSSAGVALEDLIVAPATTIIQTMRVIDRTGAEVALVCESDRLLRAVVTDCDIRRHLLRGGALDDDVAKVGNDHFTSIGPDLSAAMAARIMLDKGIKSLPVLDQTGRLVDLHTLHDVLAIQRSESWAVIMAGGKGERLGELTQAMPKPMLPVGDRPILAHIVNHLVAHGVHRIFISVNYLAGMIRDYFGDGSRFRCRIDYLREDKPLGTGGALSLLPERPVAPVLVMNGDLLTRVNVSRMLSFHREGGYAMTMALRDHKVQIPFGVAEVDRFTVRGLSEKPSLHYQINAGIYVVSPAVLERVPTDQFYPITELIQGCLDSGSTVGAYPLQEEWSDIGLPEEYRAANGMDSH